MVKVRGSHFLEVAKENYEFLVRQVKPKPKVLRNSLLAFAMGGAICALGQIIVNFFLSLGLAMQDAGLAASIVLVFLAALLTGIGIYDEMAKYAGAGMIVPITGFANSMVAPAMEFRSEGMVFGVGARLFMIAGPVLVIGMVAAWLAGLIAYLR
ncbi:stage V sporulation protein AC [Desulforamulus ferrireducens]|uniref:Stage V sporulation protein AC n=1 Tax=Desulforamulus ferrireducens TaxID=1833852 RepID=A0A1S6IUU6_9FIRM|nr:stage V sporulation protein AC [Desulforamulus ferrireducens]AQS58546.1 stage V sporulation protein AC [Desulforamulus ferrireducens]